MQYRELGTTGIMVSAIGFGCGSTGGLFVRGERADQLAAVEQALAGGVNYFDTAADYGAGQSETNLGAVLAALGAEPLVGTKFRLTRPELADVAASVRARVAASLERLGRPAVDVLSFHGRVVRDGTPGDDVSASELIGPIADVMHDLVAEGRARAVGFTGLGDADAIKDVVVSGRLDSFQCYFNALNRSAGFAGRSGGAQDFLGVLGDASAHGVGAIGIRVLAGAAIIDADTRHRYAGPANSELATGNRYAEDHERAAELRTIVAARGLESLAELGVRFALSEPRLATVLVGFSEASQVTDALRFEERGPLDPDLATELRDR